jgi:hypothetical protein
MKDRLNSLLSAEEKAQEEVEQARREARRLRTGIPAAVSVIEEEYISMLENNEEACSQRAREELETLTARLNVILATGKDSLESRSHSLAPKALELIRSAIEGERG